MKQYKITDLGFDTWAELYDYVKEAGLQDEKIIELAWVDGPSAMISSEYIKARAFEEIYTTLPTRAAIEVALDILEEHDPLTDVKKAAGFKSFRPLIEFLKKLKTRA